MLKLYLKYILLFGLFAMNFASADEQSLVKTILSNDRAIKSLQEDSGLRFYSNADELKKVLKDDSSYAARVLGVNSSFIRTSTSMFLDSCSMSLSESSPLCSSLGSGCLSLTYVDGPDMLLESTGQYPQDSLVLQEYIRTETKLSEMDHEKNHEYEKAFQQAGYFDPEALSSKESTSLNQLFEDLKSGRITADVFIHDAQNFPMGFPDFSKIYQIAELSPELLPAVGQAYSDALFLTLNALTKQAYSQSWIYPYEDRFIPEKNSLLQIDQLYVALKSINRWPEILPLDLDSRKIFGGAYVEKVKGVWKVKGAYDEKTNKIWIDFETPFFENIYVLYHELWHVYWAHSGNSKADLDSIVGLLQAPRSTNHDTELKNDLELKKQILNFVSKNELFALDQQIRLYHAVGLVTQDWSHDSVQSAMKWHDSYFGKKIYDRRIPKSLYDYESKKGQILSALFQGLNPREIRFHSDMKKLPTLDTAYWQNQMTAHEKAFEQIYLGGSLQNSAIPDLLGNRVFEINLSIQHPVTLTCEQVLHVVDVLGKNWNFGIPFDLILQDPDDFRCKPLMNTPGLPGGGGEGTHGGIGFPSLEGPDADAQN